MTQQPQYRKVSNDIFDAMVSILAKLPFEQVANLFDAISKDQQQIQMIENKSSQPNPREKNVEHTAPTQEVPTHQATPVAVVEEKESQAKGK